MKILAIDAGFTAGFAVVAPGAPPVSGSVSIPGSVADLGLTLFKFAAWLRATVAEHKPDGIVACTPFIQVWRPVKGKAAAGANINPVMLLFGMFGVIAVVAHSLGIPFYRVHEPDARRSFLGMVPRKSKDIKAAVIAGCVARKWYVCDDHAADALVAGAYQLGKLIPECALQTPLFMRAVPPKAKKKRRRKRANG